MKKIYLLLSFLVFCICEAQNPAQLDVNFDYKDNVSLIHHQPRKIVELQNGKFLVLVDEYLLSGSVTGYSEYGINHSQGAELFRLNSDFTIDQTFHIPISGATTLNSIKDFDIQSDGKIILVGVFNSINSISCYKIARLNVNGDFDSTFNLLNPVNFSNNSYTQITSVKVMPNDKIIIGGKFWFSSTTTSSNNFLILNSNGTRDYTFKTRNGGGLPGNDVINVSDYLEVTSLDIDASGKILYVISKSTTDYYGRIDQSGNMDATFNFGSSPAVSLFKRRIKVLNSGKILLSTPNSFRRLNSDGSLDNSFPVLTNVQTFDVRNIDDEIFLCLNTNVLSKISSNGTVVAQSVYEELTSPKGVFVTSSGDIMSHLVSQNANYRYARFDSNSLLIKSENSSIFKGKSILKKSDDEILIMGISQFRGLMKHHNGIKLLNRNGTINYNQVLAQGFSNPNAYSPFGDRNYFSKGLVQPNGKVVLVKVTDSYPNNQVNSTSFFNFLIRLNQDFTLDNSFNGVLPYLTSKIYDIGLQQNGSVIIGSYAAVQRMDSNGVLDSSFDCRLYNGTSNGSAFCLKVLDNDKILIGGNFTSFYGSSTLLNRIARLNSDGTLDSTFQPINLPELAVVKSIDVQSDGKILVACFTRFNQMKLFRLMPNGSLDNSFVINTEASDITNVKVLSDDTILINVYMPAIYPLPEYSILKKLKVNGIIENSFDTGSGFNGLVNDVFEDENHGLLVTGNFTKYNGTFVNGTIKLLGGNGYLINGNNVLDFNNDGCDIQDISFPRLKLNLVSNNVPISFIPDEFGQYSISVLEGNYNLISSLENPSYFNITPSSVSVTFPDDPSPFIQNFCITPNGNHPDLEISILPLTPARPGFDTKCKLFYKNKGNQLQSGSFSLTFNDNVLDLVSSVPLQNTISGNMLSWNFTDLSPMESREVMVVFNANTPTESPALNANDVISFTANITSALVDEIPIDNIFNLNQTVVNSYDPNDKTCLQGKTVSSEVIGEYVHYLIRFENTGSYNAQNITVTDYIDTSKFDISTLVPLTGSHLFVTKISEGNKVEFYFENINLPFQNATNDGFVAFKIKTKPNLTVGDSFSNSANIYFDYNSAIITNEYVSTIQALSSEDFDFKNYFTVYPNPVDNILNISRNNNIIINNIAIYNVLGQLVISIPNAESVQNIDVSKLSEGQYFIVIKTEKGISNTKFIKN